MSFSKSSVCHHSGNARICEKMYCSYCSDLESSGFFWCCFLHFILREHSIATKNTTKKQKQNEDQKVALSISITHFGDFLGGYQIFLELFFIWSRFYPYDSSTNTSLCWYQVKLPVVKGNQWLINPGTYFLKSTIESKTKDVHQLTCLKTGYIAVPDSFSPSTVARDVSSFKLPNTKL